MGAAEWKEQAYAVVEELARTTREFHANDVWKALGSDLPKDRRALGGVILRAINAEIITRTPAVRRSNLSTCHGHWRPVFRSLVYGQGA